MYNGQGRLVLFDRHERFDIEEQTIIGCINMIFCRRRISNDLILNRLPTQVEMIALGSHSQLIGRQRRNQSIITFKMLNHTGHDASGTPEPRARFPNKPTVGLIIMECRFDKKNGDRQRRIILIIIPCIPNRPKLAKSGTIEIAITFPITIYIFCKIIYKSLINMFCIIVGTRWERLGCMTRLPVRFLHPLQIAPRCKRIPDIGLRATTSAIKCIGV